MTKYETDMTRLVWNHSLYDINNMYHYGNGCKMAQQMI